MLNRQQLSSKKCPPDTNPRLNVNEQQKKKDKNKKKKKQRSPLQDLNGIHRTKSSSRTSISSSMSMESPRGCLRFFLSSNSSTLKTPLHKHMSAPNSSRPCKPSVPSFSSRSKHSKENSLSKHPTSHKPKKNPPTPNCLYQWQSGKKSTTDKHSRTNLLPVLGNAVNDSASDSEDFVVIKKHFNQIDQQKQQHNLGGPLHLSKVSDLNNFYIAVDNCTPSGKLPCGSVLDAASDDNNKLVQEEHSNNGTTSTKTPPVQASVSPEIQCGPSSVLVSSVTPACYGAGHVLSGITDRRKCRPRGLLAVGQIDSSGSNKANLLDNEEYNVGAHENSRPSLIPLPVEASMHWLLSPCHENEEDCKSDSAKKLLGRQKLLESSTLDLPSSPSSCNLFDSDLPNNAKHSGNPDTAGNSVKTKITVTSPIRLCEFDCHLGPSSDKLARCSSSSGSPHAIPCSEVDLLPEERKLQYNIVGGNSPTSINSLSSGNVIQTPKSESNLDRNGGLCWSNVRDQPCQFFEFEHDSVTEALWRESLSPKSQVLIWDPPGLRFQLTELALPSDSINLDKLQKSLDTHNSWMSNSTLENVSQSQMRISWREGLISRIFDMDEFDCCKCLSDEENDVDMFGDQLQSQPDDESNFDVENDKLSDKDVVSPVLGQEPTILGKGKGKSSQGKTDYCAESICINGGSLVASGDSDWTICYKNRLFQM